MSESGPTTDFEIAPSAAGRGDAPNAEVASDADHGAESARVAAVLGPALARPEASVVAAVVGGRRALRRIYGLARDAGTFEDLLHELERARDHLDRAIGATREAADAASDRRGADDGVVEEATAEEPRPGLVRSSSPPSRFRDTA